MSNKLAVNLLGLAIVGVVIYLSFVNWHAAVIVLLGLIAIHVGNTSINTGWPR